MELHLTRPGAWLERPVPRSRRHNGKIRKPLARFLASGLTLGLVLGLSHCVLAQELDKGYAPVATPVSQSQHPRQKTFMRRQWGVEVLYVREAAAGYMLEFRYKVHDAEKAKPLFERQTKPLLTHVRTGAQMIVPTPAKTGALRNSNPPLDGHTYWMFFANPGKFIQPGEQVNIEIGDFKVEGLVVQ